MKNNYHRRFFECVINANYYFIFLFVLFLSSCNLNVQSDKETFELKVYKLQNAAWDYIFQKNEEIYDFVNWYETINIDSFCNAFDIDIDTVLSFSIDKYHNNFFDTIYYSNYCFESIVVDRVNVCLTRNECYIHSCSRVGQVNEKFILEEDEIRILDYLLYNCCLIDYNNTSKKYLDTNYAINIRIRAVEQEKYSDLLISDTHEKYDKISLIDCFILGLVKKYTFHSIDSEEPIFFMPVW